MTASLLAGAAAVADGLLWPFFLLPDPLGLLAFSVALGLVMLLAFRWLTPQARLRHVRDLMTATVYELRIFVDSPRLVLRAQGRFLWLNLEYLALITPALVVAAPLMGLLFVRAEPVWGLRALAPGEEVLLRVALSEPVDRGQIVVEAGEGLEMTGPLVVLPRRREVWARVRARTAGEHEIRVAAGGAAQAKRVTVAQPGRTAAVSPSRSGGGGAELLLGSEPPLPTGCRLAELELYYPKRERAVPWWLTVLLLSILAAFVLRRPLRVAI